MIFNNSDKPTGATVKLQSKAVEFTTNGSTVVIPDSGYGGLSKVGITVDVPTDGAGINLPLSAEDIKATWDKIDLTELIEEYFADSSMVPRREHTIPVNTVFAFLPVEGSQILTALPCSANDFISVEVVFKYETSDNEYVAVFDAYFDDAQTYSIIADAGLDTSFLTSCEPVVYYHTI